MMVVHTSYFAKAKAAIMAVHMVRLRQRFFHHNKCGCSHGVIATTTLSLTQSIKARSHSAIFNDCDYVFLYGILCMHVNDTVQTV